MIEAVEIAMRNCIIYFLNRRRETVVQIMIERRTPFLMEYQQALKINLEPYLQAFEEHREEYVIQHGIWKDQWKHYFHGIGCRLIHMQNHEYFDWDASDPRYFFAGEFSEHLGWQVRNRANNLDIVNLQIQQLTGAVFWNAITAHLDRLVEIGILAKVKDEFGIKRFKLLR